MSLMASKIMAHISLIETNHKNAMSNKNNRNLLTRDSLWNAIRQNLSDQKNSDDSYQRQVSQKEQVLNVLFNPNMWGKEDMDNTFESQVELLVNKDSNLCAYTFFLCSNPQFKYNWSYLLNKIGPASESETYAHALMKFKQFVDLMIGDINFFLENIHSFVSSLKFVINRFIKINWSKEKGYEVDIELNELSKVIRTASDNGYVLMVYLDSTLLGVYNRRKKGNTDNRSEIVLSIERAIENGIIK